MVQVLFFFVSDDWHVRYREPPQVLFFFHMTIAILFVFVRGDWHVRRRVHGGRQKAVSGGEFGVGKSLHH